MVTFESTDDHSRDEVTRDFECDSCGAVACTDWFLVSDDLYEAECPVCNSINTTAIEFDDGSDWAYDSYYDR